jgi:hypothetical protein
MLLNMFHRYSELTELKKLGNTRSERVLASSPLYCLLDFQFMNTNFRLFPAQHCAYEYLKPGFYFFHNTHVKYCQCNDSEE